MIEAIRKLMAPLQRQLAMVADVGLVRRVDVDEIGHLMQADVMSGETLDGLPHLQTYGLQSRPKPGAQGVVLSPHGTRANAFILAVGDTRYLMELAEGEVALSDDLGQKVHLTRAGIVMDCQAAGLPLTLKGNGLNLDAGDGALAITATGATIDAGDGAMLVKGTGLTTDAGSGANLVLGDSVGLGGDDGKPVARKDDATSGGVITSGSAKVSAVS